VYKNGHEFIYIVLCSAGGEEVQGREGVEVNKHTVMINTVVLSRYSLQ
jgi:hypothetical protein